MDTLISAFAFKTQKPLGYILKNWVETKETIAQRNMIGWILNLYASREHYPRWSKYNATWKKAAWLYANLSKGNSNHILALKDYRNALMDVSDDAFLFAYRAIEDIRRAIAGLSDVDEKAWKKMHKILDTSKSLIDPLTEIAKLVRHGDKNHPDVIQANRNRDRLLNIAHVVIEKEFNLRRIMK